MLVTTLRCPNLPGRTKKPSETLLQRVRPANKSEILAEQGREDMSWGAAFANNAVGGDVRITRQQGPSES